MARVSSEKSAHPVPVQVSPLGVVHETGVAPTLAEKRRLLRRPLQVRLPAVQKDVVHDVGDAGAAAGLRRLAALRRRAVEHLRSVAKAASMQLAAADASAPASCGRASAVSADECRQGRR